MARLVDSPLTEIRRLLLSLQRRVDSLVSDALITIKDPLYGFGLDAENQDEEINRLEKELQEAIAVTFVRYQPVARDHRFLLAMMTTIMDLEHMGDCAKHICRVALEIGPPSNSLMLLLQLTQRRAINCFRALYQPELTDLGLAEEIAIGRQEIEEALEDVLGELEEAASGKLSSRQFERQILVALDLKRICDYAASIADQLIFYRTCRRFPI